MKTYIDSGKKDTRSGFGAGLLEIGCADNNVVALCADLTSSLKMGDFQDEFPNRFFQAGIAEANMIDVAAGLTICGKIPFVGSFAAFVTGRVYDQIRMCVAYSRKNVKIAASHAGLTLGEDGATHQILEDIGLMRMLPNMTVIVPCDFNQTKAATIACAKFDGPVYLRFGRPAVPNFTNPDDNFEIGKAQKLNDGNNVTLLACGHLVWEAIQATKILEQNGVSVDLFNIHTIKPLDIDAILQSVEKTNAVVTCEEHMLNGGLFDAVAQVLALKMPTPMEAVAVFDIFGESGTPDELMVKYNLKSNNIVEAINSVLIKKKKDNG
jgi:transketolase